MSWLEWALILLLSPFTIVGIAKILEFFGVFEDY